MENGKMVEWRDGVDLDRFVSSRPLKGHHVWTMTTGSKARAVFVAVVAAFEARRWTKGMERMQPVRSYFLERQAEQESRRTTDAHSLARGLMGWSPRFF